VRAICAHLLGDVAHHQSIPVARLVGAIATPAEAARFASLCELVAMSAQPFVFEDDGRTTLAADLAA